MIKIQILNPDNNRPCNEAKMKFKRGKDLLLKGYRKNC